MASLLSNLFLIISWKESIKLNVKTMIVSFNMPSVKNNLIKYNCLSCNKCYLNKLDEKFKKRLKNTFKFSDNGINIFILLPRKDVYPYDYVGYYEKFNETSLPEKE